MSNRDKPGGGYKRNFNRGGSGRKRLRVGRARSNRR